jgi:Flp pilus assembly protein TadG
MTEMTRISAEAANRLRERRTPAKRLRKDSGTSILEMAFLLPILLLLALGVIEIGRYAEFSILVTNAARAGAQYGAQNLATAADNTGIQNAAMNDAQGVPGLTVPFPANAWNGSSYVTCGCTGATPGSTCPATCAPGTNPLVYVTVDTQGTLSSIFSFPGLPSSITVRGSAQLPVAQ